MTSQTNVDGASVQSIVRRPPTGYVAKCRCGALVGAIDAIRTPREEAGKILGVWLYEGNTIIPKFSDRWEAELSTCRCHIVFAEPPPEIYTPKCEAPKYE